jgi:hypothetical protein
MIQFLDPLSRARYGGATFDKLEVMSFSMLLSREFLL